MNIIAKERVEFFSDAVIAIIITIMALEIPTLKIDLENLKEFIVTILIYFVSFSFISVIWYKYVFIFSDLEKLTKKMLYHNFMLLFAMSLIPTCVKNLLDGLNIVSILIYGILCLIINFILFSLRLTVLKDQYLDEKINYNIFLIIRKIIIKNKIYIDIINIIAILMCFFNKYLSLLIFIMLSVFSFLKWSKENEDESNEIKNLKN